MKIGRDELAASGFWSPFLNWIRLLFRIRPDSIVLMAGHVFSYPPPCVLAAFLASRGHLHMTIHSMGKLEELPEKKSKLHLGFVPGIGLWWYRRVWLKTWPARLQARLCRNTLVAGTAIRNMIVRFYGYPPEKVGLIQHGVDPDRFRPAQGNRQELRRAWGVPDDALVIVSTARLSREKGVDRLLRAFNRLGNESGSPWLLLAGDGALRPDIDSLVSGSAQGRRIKMLGQVEDVRPLLQASDIFILPSDSEGFSIGLIEAMATGLVCVSTMVGGSREIISDGETGFLVDRTDEGVLFGLQRALKLNHAEREQMGEKARRAAQSQCDVHSAVGRAFRQLGIEIAEHAAGKSHARQLGTQSAGSA